MKLGNSKVDRRNLDLAKRIPIVIRSYGGAQTIAWTNIPNQCVQCRYTLVLDGEPLHVTVIADRANKSFVAIHRAAPPWGLALPPQADALAQALIDIGATVRMGVQQ